MIILLILGIIALVALILLVFRHLVSRFHIEGLVYDGYVIRDGNIVIPTPFWIGTTKLPIDNIENLEIRPYSTHLLTCLSFGYGFRPRLVRTRFVKEVVVIKFRDLLLMKYLILTPKDPVSFVRSINELKQRR